MFIKIVGSKLLEHYGLFLDRMISQQGAHPTSLEWVNLYRIQEDKLLEWVVSASYFKEFSFKPVQFSVVIMGTFPKSIVGSQYFTLSEV